MRSAVSVGGHGRGRVPAAAGTPIRVAGIAQDLGLRDSVIRRSAYLVVIGIATVVARLHELVPAVRVVKPVVVLVTLLLMATIAARKRLPAAGQLFEDPSVRLIFAYWMWMAMTIPLSIYRGLSVDVVVNLAPVILFSVLVAAQPASTAVVSIITRGFVFVGALYGVLLLVRAQAVLDVDGLRYFLTPSLDPNDAAALLAVAAPMALAGARRPGSTRYKVICWICLAWIAFGVIRTGSRGGFIALAVGLALVLFSGRGLRLIVSMFAVMLLSVIVVEVVPQELLPARLRTISDVSEDYNMTAYGGRKAIWKRGVHYFAENPVFGVGAGTFTVREGEQMKEDGLTGKWSAPHSAYVQSFAELGAIGGLLFCSLVIVSARRVRKLYRDPSPVTGIAHPEYFAAIVAFAIAAAFLSHAYFWGFFALVGLSVLVSRTLSPAGIARR